MEVDWGDAMEISSVITSDVTAEEISERAASLSDVSNLSMFGSTAVSRVSSVNGELHELCRSRESLSSPCSTYSSKQGHKVAPFAPACLRVINMAATSATIEWTAPLFDGGSAIVGYVLEKRLSGRDATWETLTVLPPSVQECELESMVPATDYYIRVRAQNQYGVSEPVELSAPLRVTGFHKAVPSSPGIPVVVRAGENSLTLTWTPPLSDGGCPVTHYRVQSRDLRGPQWVRTSAVTVQGSPYTVRNLHEGAQYEFRVSAVNMMGTSLPSPLSKTVSLIELDVEPPLFEQEMHDVCVEEGQKAFFEARVTGLPDPKVKWFKNGQEVFDGYKHKIGRDGERVTLTVISVGPEDCGQIECRAYNGAGTASNIAMLSLKLPAKLKMSTLLQDGVSVQRGEKIRVRVSITGQPVPKITWVKDGEIIEENVRFEMTVSDNYANLLIHDSEKTDAGCYELRVENENGADSGIFSVNITDCPDPPQVKPEVCDIEENSCRLTWQAPVYDGGAEVTSFLIEKCEGRTDNWVKAGCTPGTMMSMLVRRLKESREYRFRVRAENVYGLSAPSEESEPIFTQKPKIDIDYDRLVIQDKEYWRVAMDRLSCDLQEKYIICEQLGRGTYGVVHRAIERRSGKNWAAKFVRCGLLERPMFQQEICIMNTLHHTNIIKLRDVFDLPGETVIMLELLSGCDLLQKLVHNGTEWCEELCINYMRQICQAVAHIHKNNIVHLDLKPENVVFVTSSSRTLKLADLGSAQTLDPGSVVRLPVCTVDFCSPEVLNGDAVSFWTDMWSLGVLAFLLLSGRSPFSGTSLEDSCVRIQKATYEFKDESWQHISGYAKSWIRDLLVLDKKERITAQKALSHPWLSGVAEATLESVTLETTVHKEYLQTQEWRRKHISTTLAIGHLAYLSPIYSKMHPKGVIFERELMMEIPDSAPQVVIEMSNYEAYENTLARFRCKFNGQPTPSVQWFFEGEELTENDGRYSVWFKRGLAMLSVDHVGPEDAGTYMCVATNSLGSCSTLGELHVQAIYDRRRSASQSEKRRRSIDLGRNGLGFGRNGLDLGRRMSCDLSSRSGSRQRRRHSMSVERDVNRSRAASMDRMSTSNLGLGASDWGAFSFTGAIDANIPPQFTLPLIDQSHAIGSRCVVSVQVTCRPEPEVAWFHDNRRVQSCEGLTLTRQVVDSGCVRHVMEISSLDALDAGDWRVLAINAYGQAMTACSLTVLENVPANFAAPVFTVSVSQSIVFEGNATQFSCRVAGFPSPDIIWLKDRRPLSGDERFETFVDENEAETLVIHEVYAEDRGTYSCVATNAAGTAITEAPLAVECKYSYFLICMKYFPNR